VTAGLAYRETWRKVLAGLDDTPFREFLEAKFELDELESELLKIEGEGQQVRLQALLELGRTREELTAVLASHGVNELFEKDARAQPASAAVAKGRAALDQLMVRSRDVQTRFHAAVLVRAERAYPQLAADVTPCSRDLAEMYHLRGPALPRLVDGPEAAHECLRVLRGARRRGEQGLLAEAREGRVELHARGRGRLGRCPRRRR